MLSNLNWRELPLEDKQRMLAKLQAQASPRTIEQADPNAVDPAAWISHNFYIPETKAPMTLADYQQASLWEALSRDERGLYRYSTILWSDLKKSAKTTIAAAVAGYVSFTKENAKIRFVGNDLKQADSRVFNALSDAIKFNPAWREAVRIVGHKVLFPNGSVIESVPVDPMGEAGGNDDMIEYTELWGANTAAHKKLWTETTLSPTKYGDSFRWIDTYAGYVGESETLENLYNQIVKPEYKLDLSYTDADGIYHDLSDLEVYGNPETRLFCLWNTVPRLTWQTPQYYAQESTTLLLNEFRRIHKNQWVSSESAFITEGEWDACFDANMRMVPGEPIYISLDAGISDDNFGLAGTGLRQRHVVKDGKPLTENIVLVHVSESWEPPKDAEGQPIGKIDFELVKTYLRNLRKRCRIVEISYDPYQLHDMSMQLQTEFGDILVEFSQGSDRLKADKQLYDIIVGKRLRHNGDTVLKEHVLNANAKTTGDNDKIRLVKRTKAKKIDRAVALSMSAYRALLNGVQDTSSVSIGARVTLDQAKAHLPAIVAQPVAMQAPPKPPRPSAGYAVVRRKERRGI